MNLVGDILLLHTQHKEWWDRCQRHWYPHCMQTDCAAQRYPMRHSGHAATERTELQDCCHHQSFPRDTHKLSMQVCSGQAHRSPDCSAHMALTHRGHCRCCQPGRQRTHKGQCCQGADRSRRHMPHTWWWDRCRDQWCQPGKQAKSKGHMIQRAHTLHACMSRKEWWCHCHDQWCPACSSVPDKDPQTPGVHKDQTRGSKHKQCRAVHRGH